MLCLELKLHVDVKKFTSYQRRTGKKDRGERQGSSCMRPESFISYTSTLFLESKLNTQVKKVAASMYFNFFSLPAEDIREEERQ